MAFIQVILEANASALRTYSHTTREMRKVSAEIYLSMHYLPSYTDAGSDTPHSKELWSLEDGSKI